MYPVDSGVRGGIDARLARVHLTGGLYSLARAELERLALEAGLDRQGLVDLAEARWRTGDAAGAGQAAQAHLAAGGLDTVALVIAAESAMADGRAADARRLAATALARSEQLEPIFAGMPQSRVWRVAAGEVTVQDEEQQDEGAGDVGAEPGAASSEAPPLTRRADAAVAATVGAQPRRPLEAGTLDPHQLMGLAAGVLRSDQGRAAVELALVLRWEPSLAPAVVELLARQPSGAPSRSGAALEIVRGDAYRLIGRRREADEAYARARSVLEQLESGG